MTTKLRQLLARAVSPGEVSEELVPSAPQQTLRATIRRFWPDARPFRRWIPVLLALVAVGAAVQTLEIWAFKLVVDDVLAPAEIGALGPIVALYAGLALIGALASFGEDYLGTWVAERFLLALRLRVLGHVQALSLDVFDRHRLGDLVTRVNSDVQQIETLLLSGITDGLAAVLRIVFFATALFLLEWRLALAVVVIVPAFMLVARHFSRLIKRASREKRRRVGSLSSIAEESFSNAALIQATGAEAATLERFRRQSEGVVQAELAASRIHGLFTPLVELIELVAVLTVIALGALALAEGALTLGGMLVFVAFLTQLLGPIRELGSLANAFFRALAGAERVLELLDEKPRVADRSGAIDLPRVRGAVELREVWFSYPGAERPALERVSFSAAPGETIALVGPSGAGKSTVARLLPRLYDPGQGCVRLDGHDLRDLRLASLRRKVSILFQDALILRGSAAENIALGRPGASRAEIEAAARAAGAHEFLSELAGGYDADLGERGRSVSGGQRQRIAIARALLADAPLLVLDEPTTGLDAEAREALLGPLRVLMGGRTTVIVSHDLLTVREADRIIVLDRGRVVEQGTHDELVGSGGLYHGLWQLHRPDRRNRPAAGLVTERESDEAYEAVRG